MAPRKLDPDQPVTLMRAPNDFEAQVVSHALNAEGIRSMVVGSLGQAWAGPGNPLAPVIVLVRRTDRINALRVLRRLRAEASGEPVDEDEPIRAVDESGKCVVCGYDMSGLEEVVVCPECGTNLGEDAAVTMAMADGSLLRSTAVKMLVVAVLLATTVATIIMGVEYFAHRG